MKTMIVDSCISRAQNALIAEFNEFAKTHECGSRALAIPVVLADTLLQVVKIPLAIIEYVAFAAINLFGAAFSEKCASYDAIFCFEEALHQCVDAIALPLRFLWQIPPTICYPERVGSIRWGCKNIGNPSNRIIDYSNHVILTNGELLSWFGIATPQKV